MTNSPTSNHNNTQLSEARETICGNCRNLLYQTADPNNIHWYHVGTGDVRCPTTFAQPISRASVVAPQEGVHNRAVQLVDAWIIDRQLFPPQRYATQQDFRILKEWIARALRDATPVAAPSTAKAAEEISQFVLAAPTNAVDTKGIAAIISRNIFASSPVSPSPTPAQVVKDREPRINEMVDDLVAAPPSTQPSARVAAEEIVRQFNLEKPGWVTLGRITIDRETETEKFERTSETTTDRIEAIITKHCFPSVQPVEEQNRPKIICLCGSTRFIEQFAIQTWELERQGFIVLGCTLLPMWYCKVPSHFGEATGTKEQCDELHLRKIDLADQVIALNIDGYIGESTAREIAYATALGKPVHYLESVATDSVGE